MLAKKSSGFLNRLGYSLMELSMVLMVLGMMAGTGLKMSANKADMEKGVDMAERFDAIDKALLAYRKSNERLPCPARMTISVSETTAPQFGVADTNNLGTCTATAIATDDQTVAGAVPVRTLGLPDSFAFDSWGRKIVYYVDRRMTESDAFKTYKVSDTGIGNICIKHTTGGTSNCDTDTANVYRTKKAIVALVSHGRNGHGAYQRRGTTRVNASSVNSDEIENCGANTSGACSGFNRILVMRNRTEAAPDNIFDDLLMYRMRWHYTSAGDGTVDSDTFSASNFPADFVMVSGTSPFLHLYRIKGEGAFSSVTVATNPPSAALGVDFSQDNKYMAVTFSTAPYIYFYKQSGETYQKISDSKITGTLPFTPAAMGSNVRFSPDGKYVAVVLEPDALSMRGVYIYKRTGDNFELLSQPAQNVYTSLSGGRINGFTWSRDSKFFFTTGTGSTSTLMVYEMTSADVFSRLSHGWSDSGGGLSISISPSGDNLFIGTSTTSHHLLSFNGSTVSASTTLTSTSAGASGAAFSNYGDYIAVTGFNSGTNTVNVFKRAGSSYTRLNVAHSARGGINATPSSVAWSMDDRHIVLSGAPNPSASSGVYLYRRDGDNFINVGSAFEMSGAPTGATIRSARFTKPPLCKACILSVTMPSDGFYGLNQNIDFYVNFDQPVNVTGTPHIEFQTSKIGCRADYVSGTGTNRLLFRFNLPAITSSVLQAWRTAELGSAGRLGYDDNRSTWGGSPAEDPSFPCLLVWREFAGASPPGTHSEDTTFMYVRTDLDGLKLTSPLILGYIGYTGATPTIKTVSDSTDVSLAFIPPDASGIILMTDSQKIVNFVLPPNKTYRDGEELNFYTIFNGPVNVTGTPRIAVTIGTSTVYANYVAGSSTNKLQFRYTVTSTDSDSDGIELGSSPAVLLNGGTIKGYSGENATLTFPAQTTTGILVNGASPGIVSVSKPVDGIYNTGTLLTFDVRFSQNITNELGSSLSLRIGSKTRKVSLVGKISADTLQYSYRVSSGDSGAYGQVSLFSKINQGSTPICLNPCGGSSNHADDEFTPPLLTGIVVNPTWGAVSPWTVSTFVATDNGMTFGVGPNSSQNYDWSPMQAYNFGGAIKSIDLTSDYNTLAMTLDAPPYLRIIRPSAGNKEARNYVPVAQGGLGVTELSIPTIAATRMDAVRFSPDDQYLAVSTNESPHNMIILKRDSSGNYVKQNVGEGGNGFESAGNVFMPPNNFFWLGENHKYLIATYSGHSTQNITMFMNYRTAGYSWYFDGPYNFLGECNGTGLYNYGDFCYIPCYEMQTQHYGGGYFVNTCKDQPSPRAGITASALSKDQKFFAFGNSYPPQVTLFKITDTIDSVFPIAPPEEFSLRREVDLLMLSRDPEIQSIEFSRDDKYLLISANRFPYLFMFKRVGDTFERLPDLSTINAPSGPTTVAKFTDKDSSNVIAGMEVMPFMTYYERTGDSLALNGTWNMAGSTWLTPAPAKVNDIEVRVFDTEIAVPTNPVPTYNRAITIDRTKVSSGPHTNFPVLISGTYSWLATVANGGRVQSSSGIDIYFATNSTCTSTIFHEREYYNPLTGQVRFWVRVPSLSSSADTVIYICYGSTGFTYDPSTTNTFGDFVGVYHMEDAGASTLSDSSVEGNSLTNSGITPATGKIGSATSVFSATSGTLSAPNLTIPMDSPLTVSFWNYVTAGGFTNSFTIGNDYSPNRRVSSHTPFLDDILYFDYGTWGGGGRVTASYSSFYSSWAHIALVFDPSTDFRGIYINGVLRGSTTNSNTTDSARVGLIIGKESCCGHHQGNIDEFRVATTARSSGWIATEYENQNSPSTFYSVGTETLN